MSMSLRDSSARKLPARFAGSDLSTDEHSKTSGGAPSTSSKAKGNSSAGDAQSNRTENRSGSPVTPGPPSRVDTSATTTTQNPTSDAQQQDQRGEEEDSTREVEEEVAPPSAQPQRSRIQQRPQPRPASKTSATSTNPSDSSSSSLARVRLQNDRDVNFFTLRRVTRDLDKNPLTLSPLSSNDDSDEQDTWEPRKASKNNSRSSFVPPAKSSATASKAKEQGVDIDEDDTSEEEAIPVVDLTSSPIASPSKTIAVPAPQQNAKKKDKQKAKDPSSSKGKQKATESSPSKASTPHQKSAATKEVSSAGGTSKKETTSGGGSSKADPEDALKRARTAWNRSHEQATARAKAESLGLAYTPPITAASDKYLHFSEPYLKSHPSRERDEVGIALDCRCCIPVYTAWRPLHDSSTSLLSTHLRTKKSLEGQEKTPTATATGPLDRYLRPSASPTKTSAGSEEKLSKMQARQISVGWVAEEARPLSILTDKWFKAWLPTERRPLVPTPKTTSNDVSSTYTAMQQVLRERLSKVEGAIHLAVDIWTSPNGHSYLGVIGCWNNGGVAERHVLDMVTFTERHTAAHTADAILKLVDRLQIKDKIWFIAGDNASTNTAMMRILGEHESLPRMDGERTQIRCIAHILNLVSMAIIRPFNQPVRKGTTRDNDDEVADDEDWETDEGDIEDDEDDQRSDVSEAAAQEDGAFSTSLHPEESLDPEGEALVRRALAARNVPYPQASTVSSGGSASSASPPVPSEELQAWSNSVGVQIRQLAWFARKLRYNTRLNGSFKQTCANFDLKTPHTLIRDVATRWTSTYEMIERALVLWEAIISWQEHNPKIIPAKFRLKRAHRASFEQILTLLKPLSDATLRFSKKGAPTIAEVIGTFEELDGKYRSIEEDEHTNEVWRAAARRAGAVCAEYYGLADETHIYYLAVLLHPNMRKRLMQRLKWEPEWISKAEELLRDTFEKYYRKTDPESQSQTQESQKPTKKPKTYLEEQMLRMEEEEAAAPPPDSVSEWVDGFTITKKGELLNALDWWWGQKQRGNEMEGLTALALDVFAAPATSVDVERLFSKAGHHITPLRHRLKAKKLQALVTVGAWFREEWIPDNLLSEYYHERTQQKLTERARKRAADRDAEAGPSKKSQIGAEDDE